MTQGIKGNTRVRCIVNEIEILELTKYFILCQMVWIESMTNPLLNVLDVEGICKIAHSHANVGLMVVEFRFNFCNLFVL